MVVGEDEVNPSTMSTILTVAEKQAGAAIIEQDDLDPILRRPLLRLRHPRRPHLAPAVVSATADADHPGADEEDPLPTIVLLAEEVVEAAETVEAIEVATTRVEIAGGGEAVLLLRDLVPVRETGKAVVAAEAVGVVTTVVVADGSAIEGTERTKNKNTKLPLAVGTVRKAKRCSKATTTNSNHNHNHNKPKVPLPRNNLHDRDAAADADTAIITIDPRVGVLSAGNESEATGVTATTTMMATIR